MCHFKPLLMVLLFFGCLHDGVGRAEDHAPTLEFRLAEDSDASGWPKMELPGSDQPIFVCPDASLTGSHIEKVSFFKDAAGHPAIGFRLTDDGAQAMESTTSKNLNKRLAIVLQGRVVSAPIIRGTISKEGLISGRFDKQDLLAFFHAIVLRDLP